MHEWRVGSSHSTSKPTDGGLASFPWDGRTPEELLDKADQMALQSKRQGKNAIMFGPGAERAFQMKRE